jgi:DNA-binding PadR family transcriptional regulator
MSIKHGLLTLLGEGPRYGFQLKKEFEELTGELWAINVGQIYTTLGRLVRDGLVAEEEAPGADDSLQGYRLTDAGREEVRRWFATPRPTDAPERDELTIKVALAVATGRDDVEAMLQDQRTDATATLQALTRRKARLAPDDLSQAVVIDSLIARVDAELRWLDLTSARLRAQTTTRSRTRAKGKS